MLRFRVITIVSFSSADWFVFEPVGCFVLDQLGCFSFELGRVFRFRVQVASFSSWELCASVLMVYECFVCRTYHKKHPGKIYRRRITKVNGIGLLFRVCFKFNLNVNKKNLL